MTKPKHEVKWVPEEVRRITVTFRVVLSEFPDFEAFRKAALEFGKEQNIYAEKIQFTNEVGR